MKQDVLKHLNVICCSTIIRNGNAIRAASTPTNKVITLNHSLRLGI
jgi:hypothetical protein